MSASDLEPTALHELLRLLFLLLSWSFVATVAFFAQHLVHLLELLFLLLAQGLNLIKFPLQGRVIERRDFELSCDFIGLNLVVELFILRLTVKLVIVLLLLEL